MKPLVLAMTGASGAVYAARLLEVLVAAGRSVHLTFSPAAAQVFREELGETLDLDRFEVRRLLDAVRSMTAGESSDPGDAARLVTYHDYRDYSAGIASGSFLTDGMVICPCSMDTLASVAHGLGSNLIHRAAAVHLKERRKLVVVPRETPLSGIQLANMARLADAGAVVLPAMPGFYHGPRTIGDLVDFVVARICDQLGVEHGLMRRWGES
ncbi:MAG TPA: flavin prenyltransferase UbiX [Planctomycetaceae bacterium]